MANVSVSLPAGRGRDALRRWFALLREYFAWQGAIRITSVAAALLVVNLLPVAEYAIYILALSAMNFLVVASDLGASGTLFYFRRLASLEGQSFAGYLASVAGWQRRLFVFAAPASLVAYVWLASNKGLSLARAVPAILAALAAAWFQLQANRAILVLRVEGNFNAGYTAEAAGGALRLAIISVLALLGLLRSTTVAAAHALAALANAWFAQRALPSHSRPHVAAMTAETRGSVLKQTLPGSPSALYSALQEPITLWISALFGGVASVAEVGALGRLGLFVSIFSGLIPTLIVPRLSRVLKPRLFLHRYLQFGAILWVCGTALVVGAWLLPGPFLWLIGSNYQHLARELVLLLVTAVLALLGGYTVAINQVRGWVRLQPAALAVYVCAQIVMIASLPLSSTAGVITFNLYSAAFGLALQLLINIAGLMRLQRGTL